MARALTPAVGTESLPADYPEFLASVKSAVVSARARAALAVNAIVLAAYWEIGKGIAEREGREGWGAKVVDRLAADLRREFPDMKGLSRRSLRYMRDFARAWPATSAEEMLQQPAAKLPWGHHMVLLNKLPDPQERRWYAQMAAENDWTRKVLETQIATNLRRPARRGTDEL